MRRDYIPKNGMVIYQQKGLFAFSMDSVLLGAYAKPRGRTLDLGCGSGYLALMAAADADAVVALDREPEAAELVRKSAAANGIENIEAVTADIRDAAIGRFDVVLTNPPFFKDGIRNKAAKITAAKHLDDDMRWFFHAGRLTVPGGTVYGIVDIARFQDVIEDMNEGGLQLAHIRPVYWRGGEEARRLLFAAKKGGGRHLRMDRPLYIYEGTEYTREVAAYYGR